MKKLTTSTNASALQAPAQTILRSFLKKNGANGNATTLPPTSLPHTSDVAFIAPGGEPIGLIHRSAGS